LAGHRSDTAAGFQEARGRTLREADSLEECVDRADVFLTGYRFLIVLGRALFDQLFQFAEFKQQQLIMIDTFALLASPYRQQFANSAFASVELLLLATDRGGKFHSLLLSNHGLALSSFQLSTRVQYELTQRFDRCWQIILMITRDTKQRRQMFETFRTAVQDFPVL